MSLRVGIDTGGTFTDFAALEEATGRLFVHKQLTTPADPSLAVISGLPVLLDKACAQMADVGTIVHGTTLVTNAVIERKGAVTAMLVTEGFIDVPEIARERRYDMYDLGLAYPEPLIPRPLRIEVAERLDATGAVVTPLDSERLARDLRALSQTQPIEAVAVCFLNAHASAAHEAAAAEVVAKVLPEASISTSADAFPFIREYERWTTTAMNAFAQPMFARYLARLESGLAGLGFAGSLFIMSSSGGVVTVDIARRYPVRMLESGPAAGVLAAARIGKVLERPELIAFDMGGTTAKGALVTAGRPLKRTEMEVARVHEFRAGSGLPARIPVIDLIEIGAGGGSLAGMDERGVLRVGPKSAGADPGPAAYGLGGTAPTLTDANLLLGYLDAAAFLGGDMALDEQAASEALDALAGPLGIAQVRAAWGIHETINEDVARAFRNHASERGFDYRRSAMVAFGGSGPIHAMRVAGKLRVPQVIFPAGAGVMSAIGMLSSPLAFETLPSEAVPLETLTGAALDARFDTLLRSAAAAFEGTPIPAMARRRLLDMRYRGQGYEIEVTLPDTLYGDALCAALPDLFAQAYAATFAKAFPDRAIDIVAWKAEIEGPAPAVGDSLTPSVAAAPRAPRTRRAFVAEAMDFAEVPVLDRTGLLPGATVLGPALIEERESTCVLGAGDRACVDPFGNLVATTAVALEAAA